MFEAIYNLKHNLPDELRGGLLLDIDETLSQTRKHYFKAYLEKLGSEEGLDLDGMMANYHMSYEVTYWREHKDYHKIADEINLHEPMYESLELVDGAMPHALELGKIIPIAGYLSARPEVLTNVTRSWLESNGFPKGEVILAPDSIGKDKRNRWKAEILDYLYPEVIGIVDDNTGMIDDMSPNYPGVLFIYKYAGQNPREDINAIPCPEWESVVTAAESLSQFNSKSL